MGRFYVLATLTDALNILNMKSSSIFRNLLDLIFVPLCIGCSDRVVQRPSIFCPTCAGKLPYTNMECVSHNEFEKHFTGRLHIEAGTALFYFSKGGLIQNAIHAMKYQNLPQVGFCLGQMLGIKLLKNPAYQDCDAVVGIPLHQSKRQKRGYNQAEYIAAGVSDILKISNHSNRVRRIRATSSQTRKSRIQRVTNMNNGFEIIDESAFTGKHILLVDDVLTSGATLDFCGQAILNAKDSKLSLATLAMGSLI